MNARGSSLLLLGLVLTACSGPNVVVARPSTSTVVPCSAPAPWDQAPIFAGLESTMPETDGALRLVGAMLDDRLTSSRPREMVWGDGKRLLTVEIDRAIVWEVETGRAVASVVLPEGIVEVGAVTATPDLSRAAAIVSQSKPDGPNVSRLLGIHVASAKATIFDRPSNQRGPFLLSSDGARLLFGGDVWDTETWTHQKRLFVDSEPLGRSMPHPRRVRADIASGSSATGVLPVMGIRIHQRLLSFGPRRLRYAEPSWDLRESSKLEAVPGWVSISMLDDPASEVRFEIPNPETVVVLSPAGRYVGTLAHEFTLRSVTSADPIRKLAGTGWANRALLSDDGKVLVLSYREPSLSVEENAAPSNRRAFRPRNQTPRLEAWDLEQQKVLWTSKQVLDPAAQLTPDGRFLWQPKTNDAMDLRAGRRLSFPRPIRIVSPEGLAILDDHWGGTTVLDLRTGRAVIAPLRRSRVLAASDDGKHFATAGPDWSLQLESPGKCARVLSPTSTGYMGFILDSVMFSADSSTLVAKPWRDYLLHAWDTATGTERYALRGARAEVSLEAPLREIRVAPSPARPGPLSPSGATVLDVRTGEPLASDAGNSSRTEAKPPALPSPPLSAPVTATRISPARTFVVSANYRGDLVVVRTSDNQPIGRAHFAARRDFVRFVWFTDPSHFSLQTARGAIFDFAITS